MIDFILFLRNNFTYQDASLLISILTVLASVSIPIFLAVITFQLNRKTSAEEQLFEKKRMLFSDFIDALFDSLDAENLQNITPEKSIDRRMIDFKKNLILYCNKETLEAHNLWIFNSKKENPDKKQIFKDIDRLLFCLRKEIGLSDNDYSNPIIGNHKYMRLQIFVKDDLVKYLKK